MPHVLYEKRLEYQRRYYKQRREKLLEKLGPCVDCGKTTQLELDHIDSGQKITHRIFSLSEKDRNIELTKCVVRCTDCHRKKTNKDNNFGFIHGTNAGYNYYKCRCTKCREARRIYINSR